MRILPAAVAALLGSFALVGTLAASAQASTPLCGTNGAGRCQSDHGNTGSGSPIFTENRNPGPNQNLSLTINHGACSNGSVTDTCPLANHQQDHALRLDGALIEKEDLDTGPCIDFNTSGSGGNVIVNGCSAGGSDWIVFDSGAGRQEVSVWASNNIGGGDLLYLDNAATTGDQLVIASSLIVSPTNWGH